MRVRASEPSPIPSAPFDDLDLDRHEDEEERERRVMALAAARIAAERARMERLGIIDTNGDLVSRELPPDMLPESGATVETGCSRHCRERGSARRAWGTRGPSGAERAPYAKTASTVLPSGPSAAMSLRASR
jgi:hypothetical protein